jgi:signal transduction histidine kinase
MMAKLTSETQPFRHGSAEAQRLRTFLQYATFSAIVGALLVLLLAAIYSDFGLLCMAMVLMCHVGSLLWAWRRLNEGRLQVAALAICFCLWTLATFVALFVDVPLLDSSSLLVLSVMVVLPYVDRRSLHSLISATTLLAVVVTPLALLANRSDFLPFSLRGQVIPGWLLSAIIIVIVPTIIGLILLLLWQYGTHLAESLARTQEANQALRESERQLEARVQDLQESRRRIVNVQEGVRREIASYLHGRVQGRLLVLKARLQELVGQIGPPSGDASQVVEEVACHLDHIIQRELSGLSHRLYPSIVRRGLVPALQSLGDQFDATLDVDMELDERLVRQERTAHDLIAEPVRLAAYRVAEEAMGNVVKHARAGRVTIRVVALSTGGLQLIVEDDGQGFNVGATAGGLGLAAMHDYAGAVGGECMVRSHPGKGTRVIATLPFAGSSRSSPSPIAMGEVR